jgi:IS30 family transposase
MRAYHRLTEGQRNQVYALKIAGLTQCAIADQICVNKSTISREFKRNIGLRGYRPKQAHRLACARQSQIQRNRISHATWTRIEEMTREDWNPEQITGHLKDIGEPSVSPEWIYQHIYADKGNGGDLHTRLRWALLHKSPSCWTSPIPGQTYPTTSVTGMPRAVKPFRMSTLTWNSAT